MKAEAYNALAGLNRSFDVALESMNLLQQEGVLSADFVQDQTIVTEELRAVINFMIAQRFTSREREDCEHFGKMRENIEETSPGRADHLKPSTRNRESLDASPRISSPVVAWLYRLRKKPTACKTTTVKMGVIPAFRRSR